MFSYVVPAPGRTGPLTLPPFRPPLQIHAERNEQYGQRFRECTDPPYFALQPHDGEGVVPDIVDVLEAGVRVMFFNGMNDVICNHLGNERVLDRMEWSGAGDWRRAGRYLWRVEAREARGEPDGYLQKVREGEGVVEGFERRRPVGDQMAPEASTKPYPSLTPPVPCYAPPLRLYFVYPRPNVKSTAA